MTPRHPSNQDHIDALQFLLTDHAAIEQLAEDWAEGFPVGGGEERGSTGGHSDRTFTESTRGMVDHREDPVTRQQVTTRIPSREGHGLAGRLDEVLTRLERVKHDLAWARREWARLRPSDHAVAEAKARSLDTTRTAGVGHCQVHACDDFCTGGVNDKLRTGMCPACYRAWRRNLDADQPLSRDQFLASWQPRNNRTGECDNVTNETAGMA